MAENTNNTSEEVDLGKLFQLIGKGFSNLFKAIGGFFKSILHYLIVSIIFLKKKIIILIAFALIGGVYGYIKNMNSKKLYKSYLISQINYNSGAELYNQINQLNSLISNKNYTYLSKIFDISIEDSKTLENFQIEPYEKEKNLIKEFEKYKKNTDTIYTKGLTAKIYAKRLVDIEYPLQQITASGTDRFVFPKLNKKIPNLLMNDYFNNIIDVKTREFKNRKSILIKNLNEIDSLRKRYSQEALLIAKNNSVSSTNINLSEKQTNISNRDIELFKQTNNILIQLKNIDFEILNQGQTINLITNFKLGKIINNKLVTVVKFSLLGFILSLFILLLINFNKFLSEYETK